MQPQLHLELVLQMAWWQGEVRLSGLLPFQSRVELPQPWFLTRAEPVSCWPVFLAGASSVSEQLNELPAVNRAAAVNIDSECLCYEKDTWITSNLLPKCNERKIWEFLPLIAKKQLRVTIYLSWDSQEKNMQFPANNYRISQWNSMNVAYSVRITCHIWNCPAALIF